MSDIMLSRQDHPFLELKGSSDAISPAQIVALLRRNMALLGSCALACGIIGYVAADKLLPKQYTSGGLIAVDTQSVAIPALEGALKGDVLPDPMPMVRSEVEELESPALIRQVVNKLGLEHDPEFNSTLRPPSFMTKIRAAVLSGGKTGGPVPQNVIDDITAGDVRSRLSVSNDGESLVIAVQFRADSPESAAAVVNGIIQQYMANAEATRQEANHEANAALTQRLNQVRDDINALESKIQQTLQQYNLVETRNGSVSQQQLEQLSTALIQASADTARAQANYARANALANAGGGGEDSAQVLNSSTISTLRDNEAAAERQVAQLSQTFGPDYPALRSAEAALAAARGALAAQAHRVVVSLGAEEQVDQQRENDLRRQFTAAQEKAMQVATVQAQLQQLERDADARRALYQTLLVSAEQTDSSKHAPQQSGSHIVSLATPPVFPSSPQPKLAGGFGMIGGFAFASFIALLRRNRGPFGDAEAMAAETGLEVLPSMPKRRTRGASLADSVVTDVNGKEAEALRALGSSLRLRGNSGVPRSLLFVSSRSGEGSSSMAAAFARISAMEGMRVLLVEGDIANPSMGDLLGIQLEQGVQDTLLGHEHWRDAIRQDPRSSLDTLLTTADDAPDDAEATRLIESMQMQNLLVEVREDYNLAVLDAPALSESQSGVALARIVDAVVLVVEAGKTPRQEVHKAISAIGLSSHRPPLLVLNRA
jgi:polysaccharide biosynthesis transport protein